MKLFKLIARGKLTDAELHSSWTESSDGDVNNTTAVCMNIRGNISNYSFTG